jgi:predicted transcriptional regulator
MPRADYGSQRTARRALGTREPEVVLVRITDPPPRPGSQDARFHQGLTGSLEQAPLTSAFDRSADGFRRPLCDDLERAAAGVAASCVAAQEGYTFGMKTAVSIPDDLFRRADELAERLGKSRSEIYREALADYVERRDVAAVTNALNEIADDLAADQAGLVDHAARRALERTEW